MIMAARVERGWSAVELGERVGRSATVVRAWEQGRTLPEPGVVPALAAALELDARDLVSSGSATTIPSPAGAARTWHDREDAWLSPPSEEPGEARDADAPDEIEGTREVDRNAGTTTSEPSRASRASPESSPPPSELMESAPPGSVRSATSDRVERDDFFSRAPVDAVRADHEIIPAGRPDVPGAGGFDVAEAAARAVRWVRDRWRRRRLLARAPTSVKSYVEDDRQATTYRIRQVLTAAALIVLVLVLRWAWSQFAEAITSLFDTLRTAI